MAFYEEELAKLNARVTALETETKDELKASAALAEHLQATAPIDNTPRPNSLAPGVPIVTNPKADEAASALEVPSYTHADGDFSQDGDPYGIHASMTAQGFATEPVDPTVTPHDGVPAEHQMVKAEDGE